MGTLDDFTSKENLDKFFSIKSTNDPFEWYKWPQLSSVQLDVVLDNGGLDTLMKPKLGPVLGRGSICIIGIV